MLPSDDDSISREDLEMRYKGEMWLRLLARQWLVHNEDEAIGESLRNFQILFLEDKEIFKGGSSCYTPKSVANNNKTRGWDSVNILADVATESSNCLPEFSAE